MNIKNIFISGFIGAIVYFLLGWLLWGILFASLFPQEGNEDTNALVFMFLGCFALALLIAIIFEHWAQIKTVKTGAKAGAIIGLFVALYLDFFYLSKGMLSTEQFIVDVLLTMVAAAITGSIIGVILGKLAK